MNKWRWQDYLSVLIGAWIAVSPWGLWFVDTHGSAATWNAVVLGLAIAVIAAFDLEFVSDVEEWVLVALGAWAMASPWVFGLTNASDATASMVLSGAAVIALTVWEIGVEGGWRRLLERMHKHA
jgi:hypothetical protein